MDKKALTCVEEKMKTRRSGRNYGHKEYSAQIKVYLKNTKSNKEMKWNNDPKLIQSVLEWYSERVIDVGDVYEATNIRVTHIRENIFTITYSMIYDLPLKDDIELVGELLADPDDNGNYPLSYKKSKYLVIGRYWGLRSPKSVGSPRTRKSSRNSFKDVEHHHLLLRMEMKKCPSESDKEKAENLIHTIVKDINMNLLDKPKVYYVKKPFYNEGLTAIAPIQTSHIAFHFWRNPEPIILKSTGSRCLLEFDIYTCGSLSTAQIQKILHHLTVYEPTRVDATVLNRKWSLTIDRHLHWSSDLDQSWVDWIASIV